MPRRRKTSRKGTFDINDKTTVRHTKLAVWDLYEEIQRFSFTWKTPWMESRVELFYSLPYFIRMLRDVISMEGCLPLLVALVVFEAAIAVLPAAKLWYQAQFLSVVEQAVEKRTVDQTVLFQIVTGQITCSVLLHTLRHAKEFYVRSPLQIRVRRAYDINMFSALARLDVPTLNDPSIQQNIGGPSESVPWTAISTLMSVASQVLSLVSQFTVLVNVLHGQRDGTLLATLSFLSPLWDWLSSNRSTRLSGVWAATTTNSDYIRAEGLKSTIGLFHHRQEIVAGNMSNYMTTKYREALRRLGDVPVNFWTAFSAYRQRRSALSIVGFLQYPIKELPAIIFALRSTQHPGSIPVSLASFNLISSSATAFSSTLFLMLSQTASIADLFSALKKMYALMELPNQVHDGKESYPEDENSIKLGVQVEFVNVSFRYPDSETWALQGVSFKVEKGQLCVIVGPNGSGKSTILKLLTRLYDPTSGNIYVDGRDIRSLKLTDLRQAISVLFQDFSLFPLSLRDNIALGLPSLNEPSDMDQRVASAAKLAGADSFITQLPESYGTYLTRPVQDYYAELPEGTTTLFGRPVGYGHIRAAAGMSGASSTNLSGGQEQRVALARTFMRSLNDEDGIVGLLLFDEPSASLDPKAEHDLFQRLRQLRGSKTMIFSSHRFGNLTRHADVILYIDHSTLLEQGTHDALIRNEKSEYARLWKLQAEAFL